MCTWFSTYVRKNSAYDPKVCHFQGTFLIITGNFALQDELDLTQKQLGNHYMLVPWFTCFSKTVLKIIPCPFYPPYPPQRLLFVEKNRKKGERGDKQLEMKRKNRAHRGRCAQHPALAPSAFPARLIFLSH